MTNNQKQHSPQLTALCSNCTAKPQAALPKT